MATGTSSAFAQNCATVATTSPLGPAGASVAFLNSAAVTAAGAAGSFSGTLANFSTAFLTQQGSAFVSAPADPKPDQPGGGVWVRGIGGEVTTKYTSNFAGTLTAGPASASVNLGGCTGQVRQSFSGAQIGQDISRLNLDGWNVHLGTTAGYMDGRTDDGAGNSTRFDVPFLGAYLVATKGRFFADIMVRGEFYDINANSPFVGVFNQHSGGRGTSVLTSAGYNFALGDNWFIEPSAGFIWSRTSIDSTNITGGVAGVVTTFNTNPIESEIGRLSLRVGKTIVAGNMIWQPFASASVFHEFAGDVTSTVASIPGGTFACTAPGACVPALVAGQNSTSRIGTYGQYSLGLAGQVANTGWLGFVRVDYRNGSNIDGWTGNGGVRYQFSPEMMAGVMPTKAPVKAVGMVGGPTNWTGFYIGGFFGMATGNTNITFVNDPAGATSNPRTLGKLGGGQIGYNFQVNSWVFGAEGDIGLANLNGGKSCGTATGQNALGAQVAFGPAFLTCATASDWMATAAARVGYSWGRTLFYVKGGGAWTDDKISVGCAFGPNNGANL
ncbi:MAG: autotransporter outer membrane beta-barrel domain-containing protein, partial [Proteobacteria bacterium]|nr:autotransporter outer membrane beta-barrel domain-containing protein [Pseudomonadota bacterium]